MPKFEQPALLTDPQVLLFFCCRIARQLEVVHVSLKLCPSVRSRARQFEVVPVSWKLCAKDNVIFLGNRVGLGRGVGGGGTGYAVACLWSLLTRF